MYRNIYFQATQYYRTAENEARDYFYSYSNLWVNIQKKYLLHLLEPFGEQRLYRGYFYDYSSLFWEDKLKDVLTIT